MSVMGKTKEDICNNKVRWGSRKKADSFAAFQYKKFGVVLYLYICDLCSDWHLTSKETPHSFKPEFLNKKYDQKRL